MPLVSGPYGYDCTFELDHFQRPRLRDESETIKNVLLTVLFMKPGQYPSLPTVGMDIGSKLYGFYDELNEDELKQEIIDNCAALQVYLDAGKIVVRKMKYRTQPSVLISVATTINDSWAEGIVGVDQQRKGRVYLIGISVDKLRNILYNINSTVY